MPFTEVLPDSYMESDGVDQKIAYRVFESDTPVQAWESEIALIAPKGSAHPNDPTLIAERHGVEPLIGNARTRVRVYYSNYGRFSSSFSFRKAGDRVKWVQSNIYEDDAIYLNEKIRANEEGHPTPVIRWVPLEVKINKQPRELRKATVRIPRLTAAQLRYITSQNGKLHYDPGGAGGPESPPFTSGKWYQFEAPDGIETSKEEVTLTYVWRHDPGVPFTELEGIGPTTDIALPNTLYGYFRLPFHRLVPYYLGGDRTVQPSYAFVRLAGTGGSGGDGWIILPGMVL